MDVTNLAYAVPGAGILALIYAFFKASWVRKQDGGTEEMQELGARIQEGAMAFLGREYKVLAIFVAIVAVLLGVGNSMGGANQSPIIAGAFVAGAVASGLAGYFGMRIATDANYRTTHAATKSLPEALDVAFSGGDDGLVKRCGPTSAPSAAPASPGARLTRPNLTPKLRTTGGIFGLRRAPTRWRRTRAPCGRCARARRSCCRLRPTARSSCGICARRCACMRHAAARALGSLLTRAPPHHRRAWFTTRRARTTTR